MMIASRAGERGEHLRRRAARSRAAELDVLDRAGGALADHELLEGAPAAAARGPTCAPARRPSAAPAPARRARAAARRSPRVRRAPAASRRARRRPIARSRSPRLNQTSSPSSRSASMTANVSPARPQPRSSMRSASQNVTRSGSGDHVGAVRARRRRRCWRSRRGRRRRRRPSRARASRRRCRRPGRPPGTGVEVHAAADDTRRASRAARTTAGASTARLALLGERACPRRSPPCARTAPGRRPRAPAWRTARAAPTASSRRFASPTATRRAGEQLAHEPRRSPASSSSGGATRLTRPMRSASSAVDHRGP